MIEDRKDPEVHYGQSQVLHWSPRVRTFQGSDPVTDEPVSVKVIGIGAAPEVSGYGRLFLDRCEVLRRLDHPTLPHLREAGLTPSGDAYLVFDWIEARRLSDVIPLEADAALQLIGQVLEGLECLALHNLVHWNVSPETILVQQDGQARLVGLGVSLLPLDWWSSHREPLEVAERYLAPEFRSVVQGPTASFGGAWWKADLYAMAMVTCDALGAPVRREGTPEPRVEIADDVPDVVRHTLESCLVEDPQQRPVSFAQVIRVFRDAARVSESGSWLRAAFTEDSGDSDEERADEDSGDELEVSSLGSTQVLPNMAAADLSVLQGLIEDRIASGDEVGDEAGEAAALLRDVPDFGGTEIEQESEDESEEEEPASVEATAVRDESSAPAPQSAAEVGELEVPRGERELLPPLPDEDAAPDSESESGPSEIDGEFLELQGIVSPDLMETQPLPVLELGESTTAPREEVPEAPRAEGSRAQEPPRFRWPATSSVPANRWLAGVAAVALVVMVVAALWPEGSERAPSPEETPTASSSAVPAPAPVDREPEARASGASPVVGELPPAVREAYDLYADGELVAARQLLEGWLAEQEVPLSPELCAAVPPLLESIDRERALELERSLRVALTRGDGAALRRTLASVEAQERDLLLSQTASAEILGRAEEVATEIARYEREIERGEYLEALERALGLRARYPRFDRTLRLSERAALGVERTVDNLIGNARYEPAEALLAAMREMLPEREGHESRLATLERGQLSQERWETLLDRAEATLEERPSEGLEMLSGVQVPYELVSRYSDLEALLRQSLERLDAQPPTLALDRDDLPEVRKGKPVVLEFAAADDYGVETVRLWARSGEGAAYEALPVDSVGDGRYRVEIPVRLHGDKAVDVWIEAVDVSGHRALAGSEEEPVTLKRRRWFRIG